MLLPELIESLPEFIESAEVPEPEPVVLPFEYMFVPEVELPVEPELAVPLVPVPDVAAVPDALPVPCILPLENCLLFVPGAVLPALVPVPVLVPAAWGAVTLPFEYWLESAAWTTAKTLAIEKAAAAVVMMVLDTFMMDLLMDE